MNSERATWSEHLWVKHLESRQNREGPEGGKDFIRQRGSVGEVAKMWKNKISRDTPPVKP